MKKLTEISLIKPECANYFSSFGSAGNNYCCLIDKQCVFYTEEENPRCRYFEQSVLPLEPELQFKYFKVRKLSTLKIQKTCKECLQSFIPKSRNQKYCKECSQLREKQHAKLRMQRMREESR